MKIGEVIHCCLDPTPNPKGYFGVHNEENSQNKVVQLEQIPYPDVYYSGNN
jgi:hypothetical protein